MPKARTQDEQLTQMRLMIRGLRNNVNMVANRGIDQEFITKLIGVQNQVMELDGEQEEFKAKLKMTTSMSDAARDEMDAYLTEARKVVKLAVPQEQWREFGIEDKR